MFLLAGSASVSPRRRIVVETGEEVYLGSPSPVKGNGMASASPIRSATHSASAAAVLNMDDNEERVLVDENTLKKVRSRRIQNIFPNVHH